MRGAVLLDRPPIEVDEERLTVVQNISTPEEFARTGERLRAAPMPADAKDRHVLGRLPKSVRRYLELAEQERRAGRYGLRDAVTNANTQAWAGLIQPTNMVVADQTAVAGTTEALLYPYGFALIPGGWWQVGTAVKLTICGKMTTASATAGTATLTNRYGNTTAGTSLAASAALTLQVSQTNISWVVEQYIVCRASNATGTTGSLISIGTFQAGTGTTLFTTGPSANIPASAPVAATPDLSVANALLLDATLGSASDTMTVQILAPLAMN